MTTEPDRAPRGGRRRHAGASSRRSPRRTVAAIIVEVPELRRRVRRATWAEAIRERRAAGARRLPRAGHRARAAPTPARRSGRRWTGAYELGRGEARGGRSMDALLAAYRVGARVSWRHLSATRGRRRAVASSSWPASPSSSSPTSTSCRRRASPGTATSWRRRGRVRQRYLERLAGLLLAGAPAARAAGRGRAGRLGAARARSPRSCCPEDAGPRRAGLPRRAHAAVHRGRARIRTRRASSSCCSCPTPRGGRGRRCCARSTGADAVIGPARPWTEVARLLRAGPAARCSSGLAAEGVGAAGHRRAAGRPRAARGRRRARRPAGPGAGAAGRPERRRPGEADRDAARRGCCTTDAATQVAAELFVHPQTVRYRMGQLRELYGDRLEDPRTVLELTVALGAGST